MAGAYSPYISLAKGGTIPDPARATDTGYYLSCRQFCPIIEEERIAQGLTRKELERITGIGDTRWSAIMGQDYIAERTADKILVGLGRADWWYTVAFQYYKFGPVPSPYREEDV